MTLNTSNPSFIFDRNQQEQLVSADLSICFVRTPDPASQFVFGALRAFLTPSILLTADANFPFHPDVPQEYQPTIVEATKTVGLKKTIKEQIAIFEEEYVDLADEKKVELYRDLLIKEASPTADYSSEVRELFINQLVIGHQGSEVSVSQDNINVHSVGGIVNVKASLERVNQKIATAPSLEDDKRKELQGLVDELRAALEEVGGKQPDDVDRVIQSADLVASEVAKEKRSSSFLKITTEGLIEAAKALEAVAPSVLSVAAKIATFGLA